MSPPRFQPQDYEAQLAAKVARVRALFAAFDVPEPTLARSAPEGFRMRAEFRIWHEGGDSFYAMFEPGDPRQPVRVEDFPIACATIRERMAPLRAAVCADHRLRRKVFQAEFLAATTGDLVITLAYHRPLDDAWELAAGELARRLGCSIVGRSRGQKRIIGSDCIEERFTVDGRTLRFRQREQSFSQPNAGVNAAMLAWAAAAASGLPGDLLELYCGNGNFTVPLAARFPRVLATEVAKVAVRDARHNLLLNGVDNAAVLRLSSAEMSSALAGERTFRRLAALPVALADHTLRCVFVDPPRAGLDAATLTLLRRFEHVLYVSCNPATLRDNLAALWPDYGVTRFGLFDQFPYTQHLECAVALARR